MGSIMLVRFFADVVHDKKMFEEPKLHVNFICTLDILNHLSLMSVLIT